MTMPEWAEVFQYKHFQLLCNHDNNNRNIAEHLPNNNLKYSVRNCPMHCGLLKMR